MRSGRFWSWRLALSGQVGTLQNRQAQAAEGRSQDIDPRTSALPVTVACKPAEMLARDQTRVGTESIRRWWRAMGARAYPKAKGLIITADSGGSNGARVRLWKRELQNLATELAIPITVHHLPPGTSKWNKIEHRLFSFISQNWRGKPLTSHEVIVNLIANTTTKKGLKVRCRLDKNSYPKGVKVSAKEFDSLNIHHHDFHGEWNYTIEPACPKN